MRRALPFLLLVAGCASSGSSFVAIPAAWSDIPRANRLGTIAVDDKGSVTEAPRPPKNSPVRAEMNRLVRDGKTISDTFAAIDSFDYSASRDEVIFSAKRDAASSFDIGLAAGDGAATNWIPPDPADEVAVQWAPRGNKVSYIVRAPLGDVIRTFHVPTSFQYAVDFGVATIRDVAWDPQAEKFAVLYSTPDASDRVEVLRYDGSERRVAVAPTGKINADLMPFAPQAFVLRPPDLRYNEKLPVVIWLSEDSSWNDARAALMRKARVAVIVTTKAPDAALDRVIAETPWLDAQRVFAVNAMRAGATSIVGDAAIPTGRYRSSGPVVSAAPAAIQSVAAGFIADQVNRTGSTNGSSH